MTDTNDKLVSKKSLKKVLELLKNNIAEDSSDKLEADFEANEGEPGYIKNRPFYDKSYHLTKNICDLETCIFENTSDNETPQYMTQYITGCGFTFAYVTNSENSKDSEDVRMQKDNITQQYDITKINEILIDIDGEPQQRMFNYPVYSITENGSTQNLCFFLPDKNPIDENIENYYIIAECIYMKMKFSEDTISELSEDIQLECRREYESDGDGWVNMIAINLNHKQDAVNIKIIQDEDTHEIKQLNPKFLPVYELPHLNIENMYDNIFGQIYSYISITEFNMLKQIALNNSATLIKLTYNISNDLTGHCFSTATQYFNNIDDRDGMEAIFLMFLIPIAIFGSTLIIQISVGDTGSVSYTMKLNES